MRNDAFVIDQVKRDELIAADPKSAEIIKPFLRGRDVKRWRVDYQDLHLLFIPWELPIKEYPSVYAHLQRYKAQLARRPEVKQGRFPWYALSRYASEYYHEFEQPKIVYPNITRKNHFAFDTRSIYTNQKCFIVPTSDLVLLAILNSEITLFWFRQNIPMLRGGFFEPGSIYMSKIPIAQPSESQRIKLEALVSKIIQAHESPIGNAAYIAQLEGRINEIVFEMYGVNNARDRALIETVVGSAPVGDEAVAVGDDD